MNNSDSLVLVPTRLELEHITRHLEVECVLCGFGPIVAAARTARLIDQLRPKKVLLLGIAGGYGDTPDVGEACLFREVACYGIGAGSGDDFQPASVMGWSQWNGEGPTINETLRLHVPSSMSRAVGPLLLTAMSGSANQVDAQRCRQTFPAAVAEDMEGFGVAVACHLADIPLTIVRGISNLAGDREHQHWQIDAALASAAELAREILSDGKP